MTTMKAPGHGASSNSARQVRPAQARSIATREKLIETALEVIYEEGVKGASTTRFSERAGVSRGALLHHFPTRSDIIVATMEKLLADGTQEIRDTVEAVARGDMELGGFVEFLWALFSDRFFYLSVEFINEARTDHDLRARMLPVVRHFHEALDEIWCAFSKSDGLRQKDAEVILNLTVCLVRGMGIQTILKDDPVYFRSLVDAWKTILPQLAEGKFLGVDKSEDI